LLIQTTQVAASSRSKALTTEARRTALHLPNLSGAEAAGAEGRSGGGGKPQPDLDTEAYKQFVENESFKRFLSDMVFNLTYKSSSANDGVHVQ